VSHEPRVGILLIQLGTPDAPAPAALRRYLAQFLADRRVVDWPPVLWQPILHGIVLRTRPRRSARLYAKVWTAAGSPLAVYTALQAAALEGRLAAVGAKVRVLVGMRYGEPSIRDATTGSSLERLFRELASRRVVPAVRVVPPYFDDPGYIDALAAVARQTLTALPDPPDRVVFSFHGLPRRHVEAGDPYQHQCRETARLLGQRLALPPAEVQVVYQSRFGPEAWLEPYAEETFDALGKAGMRIAVMCPGFTADCLETLEEIGMRGAERFRAAGGRSFHALPCLNDHPRWIDALTAIARRELSGWL
jgi:ferrochelatase